VQGGQARGYHTIHLLGKWLGQVPRAQTGFHVSYRHVLVEGRQGGDQCGGGVALHEHHIRTLRLDYRLERRQDARRDLRQSLPRLHQIQVVIRSHSEGCQHLVEHRAVLGGHARPHLEVCALPQAQQYRAELDRFGPRAEYNEYFPQYAGAEAARKLSLRYFGPSVTASRKRKHASRARRSR
jgi:hypothetical protein